MTSLLKQEGLSSLAGRFFLCIGERQPVSDRIKDLAHLGAGTFSWIFINGNLPVPEPAP